MICCEASTRIVPEDYLFKNSQSKFIKIKEGVEIHLIHINESSNLSQTSNVAKEESLVITEQIKRVDLYDNNILQKEKNRRKKNLRENFLNLQFNNFSFLTASNEFDKKTENNIIYLDGTKKFGMTIIHKIPFPKPFANASNENKIKIFFIHGVGGNSLIWKHQLQHLGQKNYELIAIDLIGHGLSTKSKISLDYQFAEICSHIRTIFDRFASNNNIVIGHSYGSSFAVKLSQEKKNLIQKVILISGGMPYPLSLSKKLI